METIYVKQEDGSLKPIELGVVPSRLARQVVADYKYLQTQLGPCLPLDAIVLQLIDCERYEMA